jgi:hypothetical protein
MLHDLAAADFEAKRMHQSLPRMGGDVRDFSHQHVYFRASIWAGESQEPVFLNV